MHGIMQLTPFLLHIQQNSVYIVRMYIGMGALYISSDGWTNKAQ